MKNLADLHEMVTRFNVDIIGIEVPNLPEVLSFERGEFRLGHLREELAEIEQAVSDEDLLETADGLIDLVYVALGTLLEMGIPPGAAFEEVHRANMDKVRGIKPGREKDSGGFDAIKPEGWQGPLLGPYLDISRQDVEMLVEMKAQADEYTGSEDDDDVVVTDLKPRDKPKILVIGHGRHGKDTVAQMLCDRFGLAFTSSSIFCAERVLIPYFREREDQGGPVYSSAQECFADRHNRRPEWYEAIREFNRPDPSALGRAIFEDHDIYCGLRSKAEFNALKNAGLFDFAIWVDRHDQLPPEGSDSISVEPWMADYVLDNNGDLTDLEFNLRQLMEYMFNLRQLMEKMS